MDLPRTPLSDPPFLKAGWIRACTPERSSAEPCLPDHL